MRPAIFKISSLLLIQLTFVFVILSLDGKSQNYTIEITSETNNDQSVDLSYVKEDYGSFYMNLSFNRLENGMASPYKGILKTTRGKLLTIRPINKNGGIGYSYTYTYIRGELNPKVDVDFVYILPVSKGKTIKALELSNLAETYFGNTKPKGWKAFQFAAVPGDTVFSARKGLVVEVKDGVESDPTLSYAYKGKANFILIEHEDGTLAQYDVLKKGSIMVKPGQTVFPHTPLAIAGTYDVESNTQVRFYIYYLSEEYLDNTDKSYNAKKTNYYSFVNPLFHTSEGDVHLKSAQDYRADFTEEHILKELSKREIKKMGK
jgi:murein DD-endopeptidase MepM/ murein hydrolase activator NlpD